MENEMLNPLHGEAPAAATAPQPLEVVMLAIFRHRVTNDISNVITALQNCRERARGPDVRDILDTAITRLRETGRVQHLLSDPANGLVSLSERIYDLAVAVTRSQQDGGPIQLSFHLEPIEVNGEICRRILTIIEETLFGSLPHGHTEKGGIIALSLKRKGISLEISVEANDFDGTRIHHPTGSASDLVDAIIANLGARVIRRTSPTGTQVNISVPLAEIPTYPPEAIRRPVRRAFSRALPPQASSEAYPATDLRVVELSVSRD
jgi:two-component sensor histidine kinase